MDVDPNESFLDKYKLGQESMIGVAKKNKVQTPKSHNALADAMKEFGNFRNVVNNTVAATGPLPQKQIETIKEETKLEEDKSKSKLSSEVIASPILKIETDLDDGPQVEPHMIRVSDHPTSPKESIATQIRSSVPEFERTIKTAGHSVIQNADLQLPDGEAEDQQMTGSVTELSMNDKMHKPMLPPIDFSAHSTRN